MIKKLRKSFIITAMVSVIAVLAIIVSVMNIANYVNSDNEADVLLGVLSENNGNFGRNEMQNDRGNAPKPDGNEPPQKPDGEDVPPPDSDDRMPEPPNGGFQFDDKRRNGIRNLITAETPYETRYFTVILKSSGDPVSIDTGKIAAVTTEEALEMARTLISEGRTTGYTGNFKYLITEKNDGNRLCIFVDRTRALKSVHDFMLISLLVSFGAAAAIFVLVFVFSGFVIRPIAESYEKQKKFITNAGHELKTPLAVINSCTEVIEMEQGESKWTKGITSQTERLATLTNELVALARMDEGGAKLNFEEFSLSETVTEILDPFAIMAEHKGIGFETDVAPDIMYRGDKSLIAKLCSIMADNAVKYTPENGNAKFTLSRKGRRIVFTSENTAESIEKGAHPELFDRFRRGDSSHSSDIKGYGIGLSMAQSAVAAHGGKIDAFSKDGRSLTITVKL